MEILFAEKPCATRRSARGERGQVPMAQPESCSRMNCIKRAVTSLGEEDFCFHHFCTHCYELLERGDARMPIGGDAASAALLRQLDECAQRALEISLREIELNNLDRARLLDILLWSGEVTTSLRQKRGSISSKPVLKKPQQELVEGAVGLGRLN